MTPSLPVFDDLIASAHEGNPKVKAFDTSVFTGEYVTGDIDEEYLRKLGLDRSDEAKLANSDQSIALSL